MQPFEIIYVDDRVVACNGGGGPLGHPRVYLNLSRDGKVECPYCSRLYVLRGVPPEGHVVETPPTSAGASQPPGAPTKP